MKTITVLVSDMPDGPLHARARALFGRLSDRYRCHIVCHEGGPRGRVGHYLSALRNSRPDLIYLVDPIYAAVASTLAYTSIHRVPVILDTGDLTYDLAKEVGRLSPPALAVVRWAEQTALRIAHTIIVRGDYHREWLAARGRHNVVVVPDGVDLLEFFPTETRPWRARFGLEKDELVVGGVGSLAWNYRRRTGYGWDLVDALALLNGLPVRGLLFGDGDGLSILRARAAELGLGSRMIFAGRVPLADLNAAVNALDVALVTAPDSPLSWVRTTGKLPIYLACDRFVISTAVGTAAHVLAGMDMLLNYDGDGRDDQYPARLADMIRAMVNTSGAITLNGRGVELARKYFDYDLLAHRLLDLLVQI